MERLNEEIRLILNQWYKKQIKLTDPDGKFRGYVITKSQRQKLNKKIWQHISHIKPKTNKTKYPHLRKYLLGKDTQSD